MINSGKLYRWEIEGKICGMVNVKYKSERHARSNNVYTQPE